MRVTKLVLLCAILLLAHADDRGTPLHVRHHAHHDAAAAAAANSNEETAPTASSDQTAISASVIAQVRAEKGSQCSVVDSEDDETYLECSYQCFHDPVVKQNDFQCFIANNGCVLGDTFDRFNYFSFLYCFCQGNLWIFFPISLLIIFLIFRFTSATVEEYIAEGITYLAEEFKLSEALAAVTLIALANGAGDVITAIVASGSEGGVSYNIGSLYGAGFFVCSMVICLTILSSPNAIIVDKSTIYRDCGFYILSTVVTLVFAAIGYIYAWSAIVFLLIYTAMVLVVYWQDKANEGEKQDDVGDAPVDARSNSGNVTSVLVQANGKNDGPSPSTLGVGLRDTVPRNGSIRQQFSREDDNPSGQNLPSLSDQKTVGNNNNNNNNGGSNTNAPNSSRVGGPITIGKQSLGGASKPGESLPAQNTGVAGKMTMASMINSSSAKQHTSSIVTGTQTTKNFQNLQNNAGEQSQAGAASSKGGSFVQGGEGGAGFKSIALGAFGKSAGAENSASGGGGGGASKLLKFKTSGALKLKEQVMKMSQMMKFKQQVFMSASQKKKLLQQSNKKERSQKSSFQQVAKPNADQHVPGNEEQDETDRKRDGVKDHEARKITHPDREGGEANTEEQRDAEDDDEEEEKNWADMTTAERVEYVLEFPFMWTRKITMPPCSKDNYDKVLCIIWPFPGLMFVLWGLNMLSYNTFLIMTPFAAGLTAFFYYTQKDLKEDQTPSYFFWISLTGTIVGLLWTYIVVDMLIDLLSLYVVIFRLDTTYMGLTILGIGNALPDALTTVALAKKGFAQMGITGSYAGQLFGLLIGFGLAQLKQTLVAGPQQFSLFSDPKQNLLDILVVVFALINLILTSVYAVLRNYEFNKTLAYVIGGMYALFFVLATAAQVYLVVNGSF